jgi:hypothetical protein
MKIRSIIMTVAALSLFGVSTAAAQQNEDRFSGSARMHDYVHALVGPAALLGLAAATGLDEIRDDPGNWQWSDRLLSNAERLAVQETVHHALAAAMDRSTWYYKCECSATGARIAHAFGEAFTDHDRHGAAHLSVARIAGAYSGAFAESKWRPGRSNAEILVAGTSTLVGGGILNLWREFVH